MPNGPFEESVLRLERLATAGRIAAARELLRRGNPVLQELGLDPERIAEALETPLQQLESAGFPPPMLEAIVRITNRPPLVVKNNVVQGTDTVAGDFPADIAATIAGAEIFTPSVGRIEFVNHEMSWGGTGWIIQDDKPGEMTIATNRHVAKLVARRTHRGDLVFLFSPFSNVRYRARIDMIEEADMPPDPTGVFEIDRFTYLADDAASDVALARIARPADSLGLGRIPLADDDGEDGELVAVIGYPAADPYRNDPTAMENYFRRLYDVKRFSPGKLIASGGTTVLSHDCTTLGGNSGSPVIRLTRKAAVGLHFAGRYGIGNSAVRASTLKALLSGQRTLVPGTALPAVGDEAADGVHQPDHFGGRAGYDAGFLQVAQVPLPAVPDALGLVRPSDATDERPHELRYQHFSILYSGALKSPVVGALNIDGGRARPIKRLNTRWCRDLRIAAELQLGQADYGDPAIDRGHLVRRAATNWGDSETEARRADHDSFHYTVVSPQHAGLNRNPETWLGLEDYIWNNTRTFGFRACFFAGPIFADTDPPLGDSGATIPMSFWKVVTMAAEGPDEIVRLHSTAYVLSQGHLVQQLLADQDRIEAVEGFAFGEYRTFQVRLSDLAALNGYDFGPLAEADPLARIVSTAEAPMMPVKPLARLEDVVL